MASLTKQGEGIIIIIAYHFVHIQQMKVIWEVVSRVIIFFPRSCQKIFDSHCPELAFDLPILELFFS
jgi:hypothetical protein